MSLEELRLFCESNKGKKFVFAKYSEAYPYWCVFSIVVENRKRQVIDSCYANELKLEDVFDLVTEYGEKVEISTKYMM